MKKKIGLFATFLALGLTPACKSKSDAPKVNPGTEQPNKPDQPGKPEEPKNPDTPKPPVDPKKPSDYLIATRMVVKTQAGKEAELLRTLKIEEFAWGGDKGAITLADLLPLVTFSSSSPDGTPYALTAEDLKLLKLSDMRYEEGGLGADQIAFKVSYNGVAGTETLRIPISRRDYFLQKFEVDPAFAPKYYLGGVAHTFGIYSGSVLKSYDRTKYAVVLSVDQASHSSNSLSVKAQVNLPRYNKEDVQELTFEVTGFKTLTTLVNSLQLATSSELNEDIKARLLKIKGLKDEAILANLKLNPQSWLQKVQVGVRTANGSLGILSWADNGARLVGNQDGGVDTRDVYLDRVRFEVISTKLSADKNTLDIELKLTAANEQAIDGKTLTLRVLSLHL